MASSAQQAAQSFRCYTTDGQAISKNRAAIYTLHKPARRRFTKNHTYVAGIDAQWQANLADMQGIARQNNEMKYLRTVIDVFSKCA